LTFRRRASKLAAVEPRAMVQLEGVEKRYGGQVVIHPTDLALHAGRTTALLGTSGSGKSTLLRMMIGLVRPDAGQVLFDGAPLFARLAEARRRIGYVIQDGGLFPHLTARDNVTLAARRAGLDPAKIAARADELADLARLPREALARFPVQLSGGQRQRVGLMRALMLEPRVVLLDEPLGALDPIVRAELQADLRRIFREVGAAVALVTHDIAEAGFLAEEIALLRDGAIVQRGTLREIVERPADEFVARFVSAQRSPLESLGAA
jgi:osmoprotectant transport system ATP-binding protein